MTSALCCLALCLLAAIAPGRAILLDGPDNVAHKVGETVLLACQSDDIPPSTRITWTSFAITSQGFVVSDNYNITPSTPERERFAILTDITRTQFYLQIENVQLHDAGTYLCSDLLAPTGSTQREMRLYAELIVLETDPSCRDFISITGNVVEGWPYTSECLVTFKGRWPPVMNYAGPLPFETNASTTDTSVWSWVRFTAASHMENQTFDCRTNFAVPPVIDDNHATNRPDYVYDHSGYPLTVVWPPRETEIQPVQETYQVGDVLTCTTNSKPQASFRWVNNRVLTESFGPTIVVTPDFEGWTTLMRCEAALSIEGSQTINFIHLNVTVPAVTSPTVPATTPVPTTPSPISECDDPTGRWTSSNPDAIACLEVDVRGNMYTLIRNGTDLFFLSGNGKTVVGDYKHIGFTGMWPDGAGTAGFVGECHKCMGVEVILLSGLKRNKQNSEQCGESAGTNVSRLYVMTRSGPPCRGMELDIANPDPRMLKKMGIRAKNMPNLY